MSIKLYFNLFFIGVILFISLQMVSCGLKEQSVQNDINAMLEAKRAGDTQLLDTKMQSVISHKETAIPKLIELFDTNDPDRLSLIQLVLMRMGDPAEKAMIDALSHNRQHLTLNILTTLDLINAESAIPAVERLLENSSSQVRVKAAGFLYKFNRKNGLTYLGVIMQTGNEEERQAAIQELIKYPNPETINILIKATGDSLDFIKVKAIRGLANLKDPTLESFLEDLRIGSKSWRVRLAAALAIYKLTGNLVPYQNSEGRDIFPDPDSEI